MAALLSTLFLLLLIGAASASPIGVTYNLPVDSQGQQPEQVVNRLQSLGITSVRLTACDPAVIGAFSNSNISLLLTVPNSLVPILATQRSYAAGWLLGYVVPFYQSVRISAISVGSDVLDADADLSDSVFPAFRHVFPAILNVQDVLHDLRIQRILVTTSFSFNSTLTTAFPPSAAEFQEPAGRLLIKPLLDFLQKTNSPLLMSLQPYDLYRLHPEIPLGFALFEECPLCFRDDPLTGVRYRNLYDTMIDAVVTAMAVAGHENIPLVVTETGWPSSGSQPSEADAKQVYAEMFLHRLVRHLNSGIGTPLRKEGPSQVFLYELFDSHGNVPKSSWGILYPNMTNKYDIDFTASHAIHGRGHYNSRLLLNDNNSTTNSSGWMWMCDWFSRKGDNAAITTTTTLYESVINQTSWSAFWNLCGFYFFGAIMGKFARMVRIVGDAVEIKLKDFLGLPPPPGDGRAGAGAGRIHDYLI